MQTFKIVRACCEYNIEKGDKGGERIWSFKISRNPSGRPLFCAWRLFEHGDCRDKKGEDGNPYCDGRYDVGGFGARCGFLGSLR